MLAGSASTNPMLFVFGVVLLLAWKVAGYAGADFFWLRWMGTPRRLVPVKAENARVAGR
jgi:thiosulfate dehydrogenase (quinone) large subunit